MTEIIKTSYEFSTQELPDVQRCDIFSGLRVILAYLPSERSLLFRSGPCTLRFFSIETKSIVKTLTVSDHYHFEEKVALSSDGCMLATESDGAPPHHFHIISLSSSTTGSSNSDDLVVCRAVCMQPGFRHYPIFDIKFFPDGKRILACSSSIDLQCRVFTLSEDCCNKNTCRSTRSRNYNDLSYVDISLSKFNRRGSFNGLDEYINWILSGFYPALHCVAISPDTTSFLAGSENGVAFIVDVSTHKLLHWIDVGRFNQPVWSCHYNPALGHEEFVTCSKTGYLDIWRINQSNNGREEVDNLHHVKMRGDSNTSACMYSPDGALVLYAASGTMETLVIDSNSGETLYVLVYTYNASNVVIRMTGCSSLFFGHLCQVASVYFDNCICVWKLPVVYSLETLCFLELRAVLRFSDVDEMPLPPPLKIRLKYLYV